MRVIPGRGKGAGGTRRFAEGGPFSADGTPSGEAVDGVEVAVAVRHHRLGHEKVGRHLLQVEHSVRIRDVAGIDVLRSHMPILLDGVVTVVHVRALNATEGPEVVAAGDMRAAEGLIGIVEWR